MFNQKHRTPKHDLIRKFVLLLYLINNTLDKLITPLYSLGKIKGMLLTLTPTWVNLRWCLKRDFSHISCIFDVI